MCTVRKVQKVTFEQPREHFIYFCFHGAAWLCFVPGLTADSGQHVGLDLQCVKLLCAIMRPDLGRDGAVLSAV